MEQESTVELLGSPPGVDPADVERARARAEARLFGTSTPARIGRYEIAEQLGGGGMGVVYRAFDPQLQRSVALKVLHPLRSQDRQSQQRMLLEARTLAKLDHPHIVKVHDAMLTDDQIVVVMELLSGDTLERWIATPRTCSEIVDVYAQAAEGLAAAHAVGIVHRDFKPSNAVIGEGRVRVLDFGLARATHAPVEQPVDRDAPIDMTATGAFIGTLGFASPEQLRGEPATVASDVFSFCVALSLAVEGTNPFVGTDLAKRTASIASDPPRIASDGRSVPAWLRAVIAKGLAREPDQRISMTALIRELRRLRGWRRWRTPVIATVALGAAIGATALLAQPAEPSRCDGAAAIIARTWSPAIRDRVSATLTRIGTPYALDVRDRVLSAIERDVAEWSATHADTCKAHQRGETSASLFDRQAACLARRQSDLDAAVGVLVQLDAKTVPQVMDVVAAVPRATTCADVVAVQDDIVPPAPEVQSTVSSLRTQITAAEALARVGRDEEALADLAAARERVIATGYAPLRVDLELAMGRIELLRGALERAISALDHARTSAFELRMLPQAIEASARQIFAEGALEPRPERVEAQLASLLPLSASLREDRTLRPLLLNNVGTMYLAAGNREAAARYFVQAKDDMRRFGIDTVELTNVDLNLALITEDAPVREALLLSVRDRLRGLLGEQHHFTLDARYAYGTYAADPAVAYATLTELAISYARFHPTVLRMRQLVAMKRALLALELGRADAEQAYVEALALLAGDADADATQWRTMCEGELALVRGDVALAIERSTTARDARAASPHWWERGESLRASVTLGRALAQSGERARATDVLTDTVAKYATILAINEEQEPRRLLVVARRTLETLHSPETPPRLPTQPSATKP